MPASTLPRFRVSGIETAEGLQECKEVKRIGELLAVDGSALALSFATKVDPVQFPAQRTAFGAGRVGIGRSGQVDVRR